MGYDQESTTGTTVGDKSEQKVGTLKKSRPNPGFKTGKTSSALKKLVKPTETKMKKKAAAKKVTKKTAKKVAKKSAPKK